ncbi:MAG: S-methyl-5-thioribose-1-phosphate isomerase [Peptoniphilaceae bacterium]|nr:S-methyl-5-thioribose-1-phosphate isomerase [Peptoniphilaceae bacterium]MDY5841955.1 S-methyl-5-thioribose-1-phosphate isomerase [Peptoniphilaceae bacterium]
MDTKLQDFFDRVVSVKLPENKEYVDIIDQTLLPNTEKRIALRTREEIWEAIKKLRVRGAPAIGVCAAYGMAVLANQYAESDMEAFRKHFHEDKEYLASSRPTAVNLFWALNRMEKIVEANGSRSIQDLVEALYAEAEAIREEDVAISRSIGEIGFQIMEKLKKPGVELGIETHCNAGTLATAMYGTATAPMYIALEKGWKGSDMHVYCDETRPLLQGGRLTAFEVESAGIRTTVQCDNMASILQQSGKIDVIFVGCDRVARNGDAANKIGTSGLAIIARHYGIPFYICAPTSTIDPGSKDIHDIPIEHRDPEEIKTMWYAEPMVPEAVEGFNPAFDVTTHDLITGIITEKGLCTGDFEKDFQRLGIF